MKTKSFSIFRRISILVFALITILGVLFMALTYYATTHYHLASTQLLNKDVAAHIAKFASPYDNNGINKSRADSVFKNAMIISPSAEVYFLDTAGNVLDFYGPKKDILAWKVSLKNIDKYLASKGQDYITAPDPRDPSHNKIFSAAEVSNKRKKLGYIYVILGSNEYRNVSDILFGSHISNLAIKAIIVIIILSIIVSLLYIQRIKNSFNNMVTVLGKFENGDYNARFKTKDNDELSPVSNAFNKMADLLTYNINQLTKSEIERKDFIANISHDLRTPLAIAKGYAETILIKKDDITRNEFDNYVEMIQKKLLQVEHMVSNLFEISKMESAEFKASKEPFVLSEIVQETVNTFQLNATNKKVNLKCTQCQYHVWINADIRLMERVIQNLVDNAIKNTAEDKNILVAMDVMNDRLGFKIENNGTPLQEDLIQWINNTENINGQQTNKPGTGLGLLIVKKILYLHNSSLHVTRNNDNNIFSFAIDIFNRKENT
ncbi:MAG: ATP-binding protein [Bacteroidota bacterium]|nr:ATP-binding protein [Bacteroidota bacterium]